MVILVPVPSRLSVIALQVNIATITGQQAGGFGVTATVFQRTHFIPLTENAALNGVQVKKVGNSFLFIIENVKDPLTGDPLEGTYEVDYTDLTLTNLSSVLAAFKKGNAQAPMDCPDIRVGYANFYYYRFNYEANALITLTH